MGNDYKKSDFCPKNRTEANISAFDFVNYQRTRDISIRNRIFEYYTPFIDKVMKKAYYELISNLNYGNLKKSDTLFSVEDCKQAGYLATIKAIDRYDPYNGASFKTFLYKRIRGEVIDESIKLSLLNRRTLSKLRKNKKKIPKKQSLEEVLTDNNGGKITLKDTIKSEVNSYFDEIDEIDELFFILKGFSNREKKIFIYHDIQGLPMKKIGERLNISEGRVSQIYPHLLQRVQNRIQVRQLSPCGSTNYVK